MKKVFALAVVLGLAACAPKEAAPAADTTAAAAPAAMDTTAKMDTTKADTAAKPAAPAAH